MDIDPANYVPHLELGQRVLIKTGTFKAMQGRVTMFTRVGSEPGATTTVHVNVRVRGRTAPVEFINPTVDDLERIEGPPDAPPPSICE
jgi:hypothetical protein